VEWVRWLAAHTTSRRWNWRVGLCFREQPLDPEGDVGRDVVRRLAETTGRSEVMLSRIVELRMVRNDALSQASPRPIISSHTSVPQQAFLWAQSVLRKRCFTPVFGPKWQDSDAPLSPTEKVKMEARLPGK